MRTILSALSAVVLGLWLTLGLAGPIRAQAKIIRAGIGTDQPDLAQALADAQPGDTILIADGTYTDTLAVKKSGQGPDQRITIKAEHAKKAIFSRKGLAGLIEGSFLRIEGLVFDTQYGNSSCVRAKGQHIHFVDCEICRAGTIDEKPWGDGLQFYDSAHCLVEKCHIHHCLASQNGERNDSHGIRLTHSHDMVVRGCFIDIVSGDCLQVDPNRQAWDNILIEDCTLSGGKIAANDPYAHPRFPAGSYTSENAIDTKCPGKGRPRITIRNCDVYGFRGPIGNAAAFNMKESCEAVIDRCTIHDCEIGLRLRAPAWVKVTNSVLYDNDTHCRYEDGIPKLYLYHCTFGPFTGKGQGFFQEQRPAKDLRLLNCLFLEDKPRQAADTSNLAAKAAAFQDLAKADYRLKAALPVREPLADAEVKVDRAGTPRGSPPDAGAFQFRAVEVAAAPPDGWRSFAVRDEIATRFWVARPKESADPASYSLGLAGQGAEAVDGRWLRNLPVTAGKHYQFTAQYQARNVSQPVRSILARVLWFDGAGKQIGQAEYPATTPQANADGWSTLAAIYPAPEGATQARLELHFRWSANGEVLWRGADLKETAPPAARKVRLAAIHHRPRNSKSPEQNLEQFATLIEEAAKQKADIVCLPEGITIVGTGKKAADVAEPVPGPSTKFLGEHAAKHRLHLVAGLYERDGKAIYNTSVLIGRDGKLLGKYRKVCLPREEIDAGITPGKDYPVFDTDFGRVGMMICWDVHFPEVARELAAKGAEVILLPIWGGNETLAKARAIENQLYVVASGYNFKTAIFDKAGQPLAIADKDSSVIVSEVDLNQRLLWPWLGDWRARIWREGPARPRSDR